MDFGFSPSEWLKLTVGERVNRCRLMACEASELARAATTSELVCLYDQLVKDWQRLAHELEQEAD